MKKTLLHFSAFLTLAATFYLPAQTTKPATTPASRSSLLDINTATPEQLLALPGMGRAYVQRIISGRPYTAKNQLLSRGILPEPAYEKISQQIIAKRIYQDVLAKGVPKPCNPWISTAPVCRMAAEQTRASPALPARESLLPVRG
jgi:competence protein ComEA